MRDGIYRHKAYLVLFMAIMFSVNAFSQEDDFYYEEMLQRVDTIENPVYKPVISLEYGILNFLGDVRNNYSVPAIGSPSTRFNISTFIDNRHYFTANFSFMTGVIAGNQRSVVDLSKNLNFSSRLYTFGISASYHFGHFIPEDFIVKPFVMLGLDQINFNTKGDIYDENGFMYYYWPDATIRSLPNGEPGAAIELQRDFNYETDLRDYEQDLGFGNYANRSFGIPFGIGFTMRVSQRVLFSLASEYHFTFTDYIDNVAAEGTSVVGDKMPDSYIFSSIKLHFDLFSDPKTRTVDLLYADMELDPLFYDDEDGDFILDIADHCPGTPYGVLVDTLGCPLDGDEDGVPDYLDKEPDSPNGVWVDDEGKTLTEDDFLVKLQREEALDREDLEAYMRLFEATFQERKVTEIPEKFVTLDTDEDGYISFDELLHVIDDYFDFNVNLSLEELRQVNEFFFSQ